MYALLQYEDNVYYVSKSKLISNNKGITKATYSNGRKYVASIIAKNDDKNMLLELKENILENRPHILCKKLNFHNANIKKTDRINKNYDNKTKTNNTIFCGINKATILTDKNENIVRTETEEGNCDNQITDLPTSFGINKPITPIDENKKQDKTEIKKENCNDTFIDLPTSFDINTISFFAGKGENINIITPSRDCNIETDFLLHSGINKPITPIDENGNQDEIEIEEEKCNNTITDLPTSFDINTISFFAGKGENINIITPSRDCNIETDFLLHSGINKPITPIDENGNQDEIEIEEEKCNNTITDLPTSFGLLDTSELEDLPEYVRKLNFNTIEELSMPKDACILPTCQNVTQVCNETNTNVSVPSPLDVENEESGSEYVPSEDDQNLSDSDDDELPQIQKSILGRTVSSMSSLDASKINNGTSVCDDENMSVETSDIKMVKRSCCVFCSKLQTQLARHLETIHRNEPDVKRFAILPKKNPERKKIIGMLRKDGNFKFNTNSELNNGQLIVCRRPKRKHEKVAKDFTACSKCKGFFAKNTIRHHSRSCFGKKFTTNRCIMIMGRKIACRLHPFASEILKKTVFPVMREDEVTCAIRYDELLILYANKLCIKYKSQHHHDMIRARLRLLGRFLLAVKDVNAKIENFESIYEPKVYDDCICAINKVAKYNPEEKMYETPAVAANLSTLLKHIGNILIMECIKREDAEKKKHVKDFLKLLVDIGTGINTTVLETQLARKRHKKVNFPVEDIRKLYKHIEKKRTEAFKALHQSFSFCHWISLAEATLISIHMFNKRRPREMERVLIEDFNNNEKINKDMYNDIYKSLSAKNRKIAGKYTRFCIRGKLGRTVPVLLSNDLFQSITSILRFREQAGVPEKNPYVFGLPAYNKERYKYLRACVLIQKFAEECNVSQSSILRATMLRKHVATYCIQLNLNDIDVLDLATFMGHSDKIHKNRYRQPLASRDILKISQYLEAVQGNINNSNEDSSTDNSENDEVLKRSSFIDNSEAEEDSIPSDTNLDISDSIQIQDKQNNNKRKRSTSPYGTIKRIRWSQEEKETALQAFSEYMMKLKLPSLREIQTMKKKYISLAKRTSPQIKTWLHNQQKTLQRKRLL